jgi:hypothetical protein
MIAYDIEVQVLRPFRDRITSAAGDDYDFTKKESAVDLLKSLIKNLIAVGYNITQYLAFPRPNTAQIMRSVYGITEMTTVGYTNIESPAKKVKKAVASDQPSKRQRTIEANSESETEDEVVETIANVAPSSQYYQKRSNSLVTKLICLNALGWMLTKQGKVIPGSHACLNAKCTYLHPKAFANRTNQEIWDTIKGAGPLGRDPTLEAAYKTALGV